MPWLDPGSAEVRVVHESISWVIAGVVILSVWAAWSRRHWFLRAAVVALAIAGLMPIRAYEPAILLLATAPATVLIMSLIRRWRREPLQTSNKANRSAGIRAVVSTVAVAAGFLLFVFWLAPNTAAWPSWFEWLAFGSLVLGPAVVVIMLFRQCELTESSDATGIESQTKSSRFTLRDALLAFVIAGIVSATVAVVVRKPLGVDWRGILGMLATAGCIAGVSVAAACFVLLERRWVISAVVMVLTIVAATSLHTWALPDWAGAETLWWWWNTEWVYRFKIFLFGFVVLAVAVIDFTYLLLVGGTFAQPGPRAVSGERAAKPARIALVCVCAAMFGPLAVVYCRMMAEIPVPDAGLPTTNAYLEIMSVVDELQRANPQELSTDDIRRLNPAKADQIVRGYDDLKTALQSTAYVPLDLERDSPNEILNEIMPAATAQRSVSRALENESRAKEAARQYDAAVQYGLINLHFGTKQQAGGLLINLLVGIAIEHGGIDQMRRTRHEISLEQTHQLVAALQAVDRNREPIRTTLLRDAAWSDRTYTWRNSLPREAPIVLAGVEPNEYHLSSAAAPSVQACEDAARRRDSMLRLLMTDLAIRLFRAEHERLPNTLDELCPHYLSSVPVDAYSGTPLTYRLVDDTYVLYSSGRDGKDDGGRFGTYADQFESGFDLDLDITDRTATPAAQTTNAGN